MIHSPVKNNGIWRIRYNNELYALYDELDVVLVKKTGRLRWLAHRFRMKELDPCRKLTLLKPLGTQYVRKPKLRWLESVEKNLKSTVCGNGDAGHRIENSGGQFWKRLRSTKDCNVTRRR